MATLSLAAFLAKWTDNTTGRFKDNTTQDIGADDLREFADDIADSFTLSGGLNYVTIQIGDWNMDTTSEVDVLHGLDLTKIRTVSGVIRNDDNNAYYTLNTIDANGVIQVGFRKNIPGMGGQEQIDANSIRLFRILNGDFDSSSFDSTSYNRGWIVIGYVN